MVAAMRFEFLLRPAAAHFLDRFPLADAEGPGRLDGSFYDLLRRKRGWRVSWRSRKATCHSTTGSISDGLVTNVDGRATLLSWGGTMFEDLMPQLLLRAYPGTLLDQSCRASVRRQVDYGRERRHSVGHFRVGIRAHRPAGQLPIQSVWRSRPRPEARTLRRSGSGAVRDRSRRPG